jgi:hypothetical protein
VSGIASYDWTAPPEITLVSSAVEDPYIQSRALNVDDEKVTFWLTVTDGAENSKTVSKGIKMDTLRPNPPAVFGEEVDGIDDYGPVDFDREFFWYWKSGGSLDAIEVYQFYQPETDFLVEKTEETKYKTELNNYGPYSLDVREFDDDDNLSNTTTLTIYFSPRKDYLYPVWGQNLNVKVTTDLDWPDYRGEIEKPYYDIYIREDGVPEKFRLLDEKSATDLRESYWPNAVEFKPGVFYEWYLAVKKEEGGEPVDFLPRHPKKGPVYCFTPE